MAEIFQHLENILPDWTNEDVEKSLTEALDRYVKREEDRKARFFVENDLERILEQSQSSTNQNGW